MLGRPDLPTLRPSALADFRATLSTVENDFLLAGPWIGGFSLSVEDIHVGFVIRWILRTMQVEKVPGFGKAEFPKVHQWCVCVPGLDLGEDG
jgi:glutathione S-transferase